MPSHRQIFKKLLPTSLYSFLREVKRKWSSAKNLHVTSFFASNGFLAKVYYFFFSSEFNRENKAVLAGKNRYFRSLVSDIESSYLLRRNVHRLEKGLIMPTRRKVFALDFIEETVKEYERVAKNFANRGIEKTNELKWATDVLTEYFQSVDLGNKELAANDAKFSLAKNEFYLSDSKETQEKFVPFVRDLTTKPISYEDFFKLCRQRRSVRFYEPFPPNREDVDKAVLAALQAPSACNRQPFSFRLFDEPSKVQEVASIPAGTKTFYRDLPAVAVIVGHLDAYYRERDRHAIYVDGSLAVMSFVYALECLGMSSCVINWGDEEPAESKMNQLLGLGEEQRVLMLVAYGYPKKDLKVPYSSKRNLDNVRNYNEC